GGGDLRRKRSSAVSAPSPPFTGAVEGGRGREGAVGAGGDDATAAPGAAGARWAAATGGAVTAAALGAVAAAALSVSITATSVCTGTVCPSWTLISARTPAVGAGISASTLSVEISKSGSSRFTSSPSFLSHLESVPSAIDSPLCGINTSIRAMRSPQYAASQRAALTISS